MNIVEIRNANKMINAINEYCGYKYIEDDDRNNEIDNAVKTLDTISDFKNNQEHYETRKTIYGTIEVFIKGSTEVAAMDFGDYRLVIKD